MRGTSLVGFQIIIASKVIISLAGLSIELVETTYYWVKFIGLKLMKFMVIVVFEWLDTKITLFEQHLVKVDSMICLNLIKVLLQFKV